MKDEFYTMTPGLIERAYQDYLRPISLRPNGWYWVRVTCVGHPRWQPCEWNGIEWAGLQDYRLDEIEAGPRIEEPPDERHVGPCTLDPGHNRPGNNIRCNGWPLPECTPSNAEYWESLR
jgi:hypothetical protein